ncbi:DUF1801 domain-containing protein [Arthrobacter sp. I2-34]|uniref:DUF1801 domain-containing protein n=1 Tax=Arthrobacter hankyongi TaxID=2904801 RepID=A0ABS9L5B5_9MICC|nr:DUF1801 domain-containing protein [Arthrobacter hankyongi]MCG2621830.1 DUF1801 domain-containing protein [Arthrobacter hankyongi]
MPSNAENKTQPTDRNVEEFLSQVPHPVRRADAFVLLEMMARLTGEEPVLWGPTMVGFGSYHYRYASGREGDALAVGFSPRSANLALYGLTVAPEAAELLPRLGKHRTGAACLYINKLADVDTEVLERLISAGYAHMTTAVHQ